MNRSKSSQGKRCQRDHNLGPELVVVSKIEKGYFIYEEVQKK